jgi:hypothetical protein
MMAKVGFLPDYEKPLPDGRGRCGSKGSNS